VYDNDRDTPRVSMPRPELHVVARFGPSARGGLDVHAFGVREVVHRKLIRAGQRIVMARLQLGVGERVLGARASAITGRVFPLDELWGSAAARDVCERLADTRDSAHAATVLERAIAKRSASAEGHDGAARLALEAAARLATKSVNTVAFDLGVSERHLRRVFRDTMGVGPKGFAKLLRFHRALRAARSYRHASWADVAAVAGYYDQAHLIGEFRAIAGVTPRALLREMGDQPY
jgi:AraC-like DNA-binding protein